jgi:hypothetical protein
MLGEIQKEVGTCGIYICSQNHDVNQLYINDTNSPMVQLKNLNIALYRRNATENAIVYLDLDCLSLLDDYIDKAW